jgi:very-short-patch-repair endonuclease
MKVGARPARTGRAGVVARRDLCVARRAASSWGVLSARELAECGLSHDAIMRRARRGALNRIHRGVYAVGHSRPPPEGMLLAAVKACGPGAVASHASAAWLWGLVERAGAKPEVTVPGPSALAHAGIDGHRTAILEQDDRALLRGVPVTAPARTLIDLAGRFSRQPLRRAVRQAQSLGLVSPGELLEAIERLGPRRGSRMLAEIVATGPAPTRSGLEDVVLELLLNGGLAHPDVNKPLFLDGHRVIPDFRWPDQALVLEADSRKWHENQTAREDDAERQALLEAHGERVVRVTWAQAVWRPHQTLARVRRAGAPLLPER